MKCLGILIAYLDIFERAMKSGLVWLPKWLGAAYASLHVTFMDGLFTFERAAIAMGSRNPKLVLSLLRRMGWLAIFGRDGKKRSYRLLRPEAVTYSLALGASVNPKQGRYANLVASVLTALACRYGERLRAVAVFGSVARGTANLDSDMDVLVVAKFQGDIASRIDELVEIEFSGQIRREIVWLANHGVRCHISWFPLTAEEATQFRPLYLDMVEDALIVYDRSGLLRKILAELQKILQRQGAKRIWLDKERWYWNLKPDIGRELVVTV